MYETESLRRLRMVKAGVLVGSRLLRFTARLYKMLEDYPMSITNKRANFYQLETCLAIRFFVDDWHARRNLVMPTLKKNSG